jgi:DUF971 family protein
MTSAGLFSDAMTSADLADDRVTARRIDYDEPARALLVEWADGALHRIPFAELRRGCPCAECSGEMGRPGRFDLRPELARNEDELADIHLVGSYAMGARWKDGHSTGIYTFEYLRRLGEKHGAPAS